MEVGNEVEIEPLRADTKLATGGKQAENQIQIRRIKKADNKFKNKV
ncbi:hypothetical protein ACFLW7_03210 [Chloroflexota bacterium]